MSQDIEIQEFEFGDSQEIGILFLHGWTSSPRELRFLAQELSQSSLGSRGVRCLGPRLPGHGTQPSDLDSLSSMDYLKVAQEALTTLKCQCSKVYIVGLSFGGAIALQLAKTFDINGLILMAPFLHLTDPTLMGIPKRSIIKMLPESIKPIDKGTPGIADPIERAKHYSYSQVSIPALRVFFESVESFTQDLSEVQAPLLLLHSIKDETSDFQNSTSILEQVSSEDRRLIAYHRSNHILTLDYDKFKVSQEIQDWLSQRNSTPRGAP